MNQNVVRIAVPVLSVGILAVGWFMLPALQGSARAVEVEASLRVERARRLLYQYDAGLAYTSLLIDEFGEEGLEVEPADLSDEMADEYQQLHTNMWEKYTPTDWSRDRPTPARADYRNLSRQIGDALTEHARLSERNAALLDQALAAVDQALAVTDGMVSSQSDAEANHLRAVIFHHKAMAEWVRARLKRREADADRRRLAALAADAAAVAGTKTLIVSSNIDEQIVRLEAAVKDAATAARADREALETVTKIVQDLEARLTAARAQADKARQAMDRLKATGLDFSDPNAAQTYRAKLETLDRRYRQAARLAHALEFGTFSKARLDPIGDYLHGRYVENGSKTDLTVEFGLAHYRNTMVAATASLQDRDADLDALRADLARLKDLRRSYEETQEQVTGRLAAAADAATETYDDLNRVEAEAFAIEEKALRLFDQAASVAKRAAQFSEQWVRDAQERTRGLSPDAQKRSAFDLRTRDRWMGAFTAAEEADARLGGAWVQYDRYLAATQNAALLAHVAAPLVLQEVDVEAERVKASDAHDAGVEQIQRAMDVLQKTHRDTGKSWTVSAQGAGAIYLMVLFGHSDYVADAIAAYDEALRGREDEPFAQALVIRLKRLRESVAAVPAADQ